MSKETISRKQALRRLGGLALGTPFGLPLLAQDSLKLQKPKAETKPVLKAPQQPHIIFIMTDQQRADSLGCAGNPQVLTPHIDALAGEGTLFEQAYSPVPSCTPARSCLLTGMNPWNNGMLGYGRVAREYRYELPRMLKEAGYYTFCVGKNHWYPQKTLHGFNGTLVDESGRIEQDGFISDYRDWFKLTSPGKDPDATGVGWNSRLAKAYALEDRLHPTAWIGQTAVDFIDNFQMDAPLFLKVSFERPHSPYDPPQSALDRYKDIKVDGPAIGDWEGKIYNYPDQHKAIPTSGPPDAAFGDFGEALVKNSKKHYYANITFIDDQVGKIVAKLKERGMYAHSMICFISDHGDEMGDHYHWRKTFPYQGSVHVPFVVKWPERMSGSVQKGGRPAQPVGLQDVLPTFLDVAGKAAPEDMDGKSVLPLAQGQGAGWRPYIGLEHATCYYKNNYWAAVTDGKRKYIWHFYTGQEQFFDLQADPQEKKDLIDSRSHLQEISQWRNYLVDYLAERGSDFVRNGKPVRRTKTMTYSPHHPQAEEGTAKKQAGAWRKEEKRSFTLK